MDQIVDIHFCALKKMGLKISNEKNLKNILKSKHVSWYKEIIKFARRNSLPVEQEIIEAIYRADIVIKRMIDEYLKAFETSLKTKIMICAEKFNWNLEDDKNFCILFDNWKNAKPNVRDRKNDSLEYLKKGIIAIKNKSRNNWNEIVDEMQLGQLIALVDVVDISIFNNLFIWESYLPFLTRNDVVEKMKQINQLRNLIAHTNILFKLHPFISKKFEKLKLSSVIDSMHELLNGNYKENLKQKIKKYKNNCISKKDKGEWYMIDNKTIESIFIAIQNEVLNEQ